MCRRRNSSVPSPPSLSLCVRCAPCELTSMQHGLRLERGLELSESHPHVSEFALLVHSNVLQSSMLLHFLRHILLEIRRPLWIRLRRRVKHVADQKRRGRNELSRGQRREGKSSCRSGSSGGRGSTRQHDSLRQERSRPHRILAARSVRGRRVSDLDAATRDVIAVQRSHGSLAVSAMSELHAQQKINRSQRHSERVRSLCS